MRFVILALLAGCATLTPMAWNRAPPADWPKLAENLHVVDEAQLKAGCASIRYPAGSRPVDCALVNFTLRVCTVYVLASIEGALAHAEGHCRGYDHPGESTMRDAWAKWKERNPGRVTVR